MPGESRHSEKGFFNSLFRSRPRYVTVPARRAPAPVAPAAGPEAGMETGAADAAALVRLDERGRPVHGREVPDGLWTKCDLCGQILYTKELVKNSYVCYRCQAHLRLPARDRLAMMLDYGLEEEFDADLVGEDPLQFPEYAEKLWQARQKTGQPEAVITGRGQIEGEKVCVGVLDFNFMGGSMGWAVGEKVARLFDRARAAGLPVVFFSSGGGGARMQEGAVSLMQMATTVQAVSRFSAAGGLYVAVLTDPTMGGVYASFGSLGDVILAEPGARIGFTGPRVIEQTIRQKLPAGFQTAEFLLKNGMIDAIVDRREMKRYLARLLRLHRKPEAR